MPRCDTYAELTGMEALSFATSHELIEGSTDPLIYSSPAYDHVDDDHFAWSYVFMNEAGDLCAAAQVLSTKPDDLGFLVQRTWSNNSVKAGHHPCVPTSAAPYFNSAPVFPDTLTFTTNQGQLSVTTKGVRIPVGESRTVDVQLFSDAPVGDWQVMAIDWAGFRTGQNQELAFSFDRASGNNGDTLHLTIQSLVPSADGFSPFLIQSRSGNEVNFWVGAVANN
jgi:hypothetical protein